MTWTSQNATSATLDQGVGDIPVNGSIEVYPESGTTYTLTVTGPGGTDTAQATVAVDPAEPVATIGSTPGTIQQGRQVLLSFSTSHADTVTIDQGVGSVPASGMVSVAPQADTTYTLTATGPGGTAYAETTVTVTDGPDALSITNCPSEALTEPEDYPLAVELSFPDQSVLDATGMESGTFYQSSDEATALVSPSGRITPLADGATIITARNGDLSDTCSITVDLEDTAVTRIKLSPWNHVLSYPGDTVDMTVSGIQANGTIVDLTGSSTFVSMDSSIAEIDETGLVTANGNGVVQIHATYGALFAAAPVTVSIAGNPEQTDASGWINGVVTDPDGDPVEGATITMDGTTGQATTDADGAFAFPTPAGTAVFRITAEKAGYTYAYRTGQVLSGHDTTVNPPVVLTPLDTASTMIGAGGGTHESSGGDVEVVIPAGATDETIEVRATNLYDESQIPPLPDTSDFAYCVKLDPDLYEFDRSVTIRIANTLNFPVGTLIPVGIYSRDQGLWRHADMATVTSDGLWVEARTRHFSYCDINDAIFLDFLDKIKKMDPFDITPEPTRTPGGACSGTPGCSLVSQQDGSLQERHRLPDYKSMNVARSVELVYNSSHADPRFPLAMESYGDVDGQATKNSVVFSVEGRRKEVYYQTDDGLDRFAWMWDGRNGRGEALPTGVYPYTIDLTHHFRGVYGQQLSFGGATVGPLDVDGRQDATIVKTLEGMAVIVNSADSPFGAGWGIDGLQRLHLGENVAQPLITDGNGSTTVFETKPGRQLVTSWDADEEYEHIIRCTFPDGRGGLYLGCDRIILHVDANGGKRIVAGDGSVGSSGDNGPAIEAQVGFIEGLYLDSMGNLFFAEYAKVRRIDTNGIITTVAGDGTAGNDGDGGPATLAHLKKPVGIVMGPDGSLYISDNEANRIRKIDATGIISTIAGSGLGGYGGDGGPATEALISYPSGMVLDSKGNLFFADYYNNRVRKIDTDGIITTYAGQSGTLLYSYPDDGVPADTTDVCQPVSVAMGPDGCLYISNEWVRYWYEGMETRGPNGTHIMKVDKDGLITNVDNYYYHYARAGVGGDVPTFYKPRMSMDRLGNIFIHAYDDENRNLIYKTTPQMVVDGAWTTYSTAGDFSTLTRETDGTYTRAYLHGDKVRFDDQGYQTSAEDRNGNVTTFSQSDHDGLMLLDSITDPMGKTTEFYYASGRLSSITDPAGRTTNFTINEINDLTDIENPNGSVRSFAYAGSHRIVEQTDAGASRTQYHYDDMGCIDEVTYEDSSKRKFKCSLGQALSNLIPAESGSQSNPAEPSPVDMIESSYTDATGRTRQYRLNAYGAATGIENGLKSEKEIRRNYNNLPIELTSAEGRKATALYDDLGLLVSMVQEGTGAETVVDYKPDFYFPELVTDPDNNEIAYEYDEKGNTTKITDQLGKEWLFAYNSRGQLLTATNPDQQQTEFEYYDAEDGNGNLKIVRNHLDQETLFEYDAYGNTTRIQTAEGEATQTEYDEMNLPTVTVNPLGDGTTLSWTMAEGTRTSVSSAPLAVVQESTDAAGRPTTYSYDQRYRVVAINAPLDRAIGFAYDSEGRIVSFTDAKEQTTLYEYDAAGREVLKSFDDGARLVTTYDRDGYIVGLAENSDRISYEYDTSGRLVATTHHFAQGPSQVLTYQYDDLNRLVRKTDSASGLAIDYAYGDSGLLTGIDAGAGKQISFGYDDSKRLSSVQYPNGTSFAVYRDGVGRTTGIDHKLSGSPFLQMTYEYDNAGKLTGMTDAEGEHAYVYDAAGQLTGADHPEPSANPDESFYYDPMGNRTGSHLSAGYTVDDADQLTEDQHYDYQYDNNGSLTEKTAKSDGAQTVYIYDVRNRMVGVELPDGSTRIDYGYDVLNRLVSRVKSDGETRLYRYDGRNLAAVLDGEGNVLAGFVQGFGMDSPLIMERDGENYCYHTDRLGSVVALTDEAGTISNTYVYDSFGRIMDRTEAVENPFAFTGAVFDEDTGLYYFRSRFYDPETGRFLQKDPLNIQQDISAYAYASNSPANLVDPSGQVDCAAEDEEEERSRKVENEDALLDWARSINLSVPSGSGKVRLEGLLTTEMSSTTGVNGTTTIATYGALPEFTSFSADTSHSSNIGVNYNPSGTTSANNSLALVTVDSDGASGVGVEILDRGSYFVAKTFALAGSAAVTPFVPGFGITTFVQNAVGTNPFRGWGD